MRKKNREIARIARAMGTNKPRSTRTQRQESLGLSGRDGRDRCYPEPWVLLFEWMLTRHRKERVPEAKIRDAQDSAMLDR